MITPWKGADHFDAPRRGAREFLERLRARRLDRGAVVAAGHHRELVETSPLYRQLVAEFVDSQSD